MYSDDWERIKSNHGNTFNPSTVLVLRQESFLPLLMSYTFPMGPMPTAYAHKSAFRLIYNDRSRDFASALLMQ